MPLARLNSVIKQVVRRIKRSPTYMQEMPTRYAFIDPMLRVLDWDTENPDQVEPEYRRKPLYDYLLTYQEKKVAIVEAKLISSRLPSAYIKQRIEDCRRSRIPYCVYTNGRCWQIYDVNKGKCVVEIDLKGKSADVASQMLFLWRPYLSLGKADGRRLRNQPEGEVKVISVKPRDMNHLIESNAWDYLEPNEPSPKYVAVYVSKPVQAIQYWGIVEDDEESPEEKRKLIVKQAKLWSLASPIRVRDDTDLRQGTGFYTSMSKLYKAYQDNEIR